MRDVSRLGGSDREMVNVGAVIDELERVTLPTGFARGRLAAVRMSKLEPNDRNRVEALVGKWRDLS